MGGQALRCEEKSWGHGRSGLGDISTLGAGSLGIKRSRTEAYFK